MIRPLLLLALLALPSGAAVVGRPTLGPALGQVSSAPGFQASLLSQIQVAASLAGTPAHSLSLTPLTAAIASPAPATDPWRPEAARLVTALISQPGAVSANKETLRLVLGEKGFTTLAQAAGRVQAKAAQNAGLQETLKTQAAALDLDDDDSVEQLGTRLNALFENSKIISDLHSPAVTVGQGAEKKPLVSLVAAGTAPEMDPAALDAYIEKNSVVSPRGLKRVNFASGEYRPEYDAALRRRGVDQVVIKTPSRAELGRFSEEDGYHLKSEYQRWVMTTRTQEEHEKSLGKSQRVRQFQNQLADSAGLTTEIGPLTVEKFEEWYPIYEDEVVGKPGGKRNVAKDFAAKLKEKGQLDGGWYGLFYYDSVDKTKMVGGVIMKAWPERGMFVLGYAAYRNELKDVSPSVRTFSESMKLARSLGFKVLSFGQDTNFFGYDYNLGLMSNKAGFLLTPYPEDEIVLLKVLDASKPLSVKNKNGQSGGYMFFGIKRDSPIVERYLQSKDAGAPKEAQELLGSDHYFDDNIVPAQATTVAWHFRGEDPNPLRVPVGIDLIER